MPAVFGRRHFEMGSYGSGSAADGGYGDGIAAGEFGERACRRDFYLPRRTHKMFSICGQGFCRHCSDRFARQVRSLRYGHLILPVSWFSPRSRLTVARAHHGLRKLRHPIVDSAISPLPKICNILCGLAVASSRQGQGYRLVATDLVNNLIF